MTEEIQGKDSARPADPSTSPDKSPDEAPAPADAGSEFSKMLDAFPQPHPPARGDVVKGRLVQIGDAGGIVDIGAKSEACIAREELLGPDGDLAFKVGDTIEARIISADGDLRISRETVSAHMSRNETRDLLMEARRKRLPVKGRVTASVKGGYEVQVAGMRAFCPFSQIDVKRQEEPLLYFNKTFDFLIKEFDPRRKNLILSRRALIEAENKQEESKVRESLTPGTVVEGTVVSLQDFGGFIDLGSGVQGLLHVSEISHARVEHPRDALTIGQTLKVEILKNDRKKSKISLTRKSLEADPWDGASRRFAAGQVIGARVVRMTEFGAFVELAPGLDGLLHLSELNSLRRTEDQKPEDLARVGTDLKVAVLKVDEKRRRISLGLADQSAEVGRKIEIPQIRSGKVVTGKVERVEKFGVFVRLGPGLTGLIPNNELGTPRGTDHRRMFPPGTEITAEITEADASGRKIRLSVSKAEGREEREAIERYRREGAKSGNSLSTMAEAFRAFRDSRETGES